MTPYIDALKELLEAIAEDANWDFCKEIGSKMATLLMKISSNQAEREMAAKLLAVIDHDRERLVGEA